jgi:arylsulfatase
MKGLKGSADEGGVRVPFFIRWDGKIKADNQIDHIAAHIDILPSLAALAGAKVPEKQVEGRSFLPLIENPDSSWPDRYLFTQKARWKTGEEPNDHQWKNYAVRNHRYRFVGGGGGDADSLAEKDALYDMEKDPAQTTNVIADHEAVALDMKKAYDTFWKEARPLMVNEEAPMSPTRPYHVLFEKQMKEGGIPEWKAPKL